MSTPEVIKYMFDFAFSGFWHWVGVCLLVNSLCLIKVDTSTKVQKEESK